MVFQSLPSKRWTRSLPLTSMPTSMSRPCEVTVDTPVVALLVMSTLLTATPTPMPTVPAASALPVPFALASVLAKVFRVSGPPVAVTTEPSARDASEIVLTMLIAAAPATVTVLPSEPLLPVSFLSEVVAGALLVSVVLDDLPVLAELSLFAFVIWSVALWFTSLPEVSSFVASGVAPCLVLPFAPVALAFAVVTLADDPVAVSDTDLPERVRELVAVTSSSGIARARARPITTLPVTASAFALVVVLAV